MEHLYAIIIAGGAGTRFWPASTERRPKQLLALGKDPAEPLLAATVRRIEPLVPPSRILVATGAHLAAATREIVPQIPAENILAEPIPRNTAPCIGWAAHAIARRDPDAVAMVFPADHDVRDEDEFRDVLQEAARVALTGAIATVGLAPTRPETGYGYIEVGAPLGAEFPRAARVQRFVEKPNRQRAEEFLAGGRHVWNGGMFFFRASRMKQAIAAHLPALAEGLDKLDHAALAGHEPATLARVFPTLPSISIDHGVMEHEPDLAVVRGSFGWSDVGSWESAWELSPKDAADNADGTPAIYVDAKRNLVRDLRSNGSAGDRPRVIALVGVEDLVVVQTDDALLVMRRDRAQDVRAVVDELKRSGSRAL